MCWRFFGAPQRRMMGESLGLDIVGLRKDGSELPLQISLAALQLGRRAGRLRRHPRPRAAEGSGALPSPTPGPRPSWRASLKSEFLGATSRNLMRPLQTIGLLSGILARTVMQRDAQDVVSRGWRSRSAS